MGYLMSDEVSVSAIHEHIATCLSETMKAFEENKSEFVRLMGAWLLKLCPLAKNPQEPCITLFDETLINLLEVNDSPRIKQLFVFTLCRSDNDRVGIFNSLRTAQLLNIENLARLGDVNDPIEVFRAINIIAKHQLLTTDRFKLLCNLTCIKKLINIISVLDEKELKRFFALIENGHIKNEVLEDLIRAFPSELFEGSTVRFLIVLEILSEHIQLSKETVKLLSEFPVLQLEKLYNVIAMLLPKNIDLEKFLLIILKRDLSSDADWQCFLGSISVFNETDDLEAFATAIDNKKDVRNYISSLSKSVTILNELQLFNSERLSILIKSEEAGRDLLIQACLCLRYCRLLDAGWFDYLCKDSAPYSVTKCIIEFSRLVQSKHDLIVGHQDTLRAVILELSKQEVEFTHNVLTIIIDNCDKKEQDIVAIVKCISGSVSVPKNLKKLLKVLNDAHYLSGDRELEDNIRSRGAFYDGSSTEFSFKWYVSHLHIKIASLILDAEFYAPLHTVFLNKIQDDSMRNILYRKLFEYLDSNRVMDVISVDDRRAYLKTFSKLASNQWLLPIVSRLIFSVESGSDFAQNMKTIAFLFDLYSMGLVSKSTPTVIKQLIHSKEKCLDKYEAIKKIGASGKKNSLKKLISWAINGELRDGFTYSLETFTQPGIVPLIDNEKLDGLLSSAPWYITEKFHAKLHKFNVHNGIPEKKLTEYIEKISQLSSFKLLQICVWNHLCSSDTSFEQNLAIVDVLLMLSKFEITDKSSAHSIEKIGIADLVILNPKVFSVEEVDKLRKLSLTDQYLQLHALLKPLLTPFQPVSYSMGSPSR